MRPLYEINNDILACLDMETGEILDDEALERLSIEREKKIEGVALWRKNLAAEADMLKAEEKNLAERRKSSERTIESLDRWLKYHLDGEKFSTPQVNVTWRKSSKVEIDDISLLPTKFLKQEEPQPMKAEIKAYLKEHPDGLLGAHIEENLSMTIK